MTYHLLTDSDLERYLARGRRARSQAFYAALAALGRGVARLAGLAGAAPRRLAEGWRRGRARRLAIAELAALDDRMLRDIGLSRAEIPSIVAELQGAAAPSRRRVAGAAVSLPRAALAAEANDNCPHLAA